MNKGATSTAKKTFEGFIAESTSSNQRGKRGSKNSQCINAGKKKWGGVRRARKKIFRQPAGVPNQICMAAKRTGGM